MHRTRSYISEWPSLAVLAGVYVLWLGVLFSAETLGPLLTILCLAPLITLHSSLQHEALHILEPKRKYLTQALIFPAIGLFIPYLRFRDLHLAHHRNEYLTDPYDDPESCYLAPEVWNGLPRWKQKLLTLNNTLLGRMVFGPLIGQIAFMIIDWKAIKNGDQDALRGWVWHVPAVLIVLAIVAVSPVGFVTYFAAAYLGLSVLKIRTFLEHRAEECANGRSVIIEDKGPLAFLFLNNNLHAVHHANPSVPWYRLPRFYRAAQDRFLKLNKNYRFDSYLSVFKMFFVKPKEPVAHPIWSHKNRSVR